MNEPCSSRLSAGQLEAVSGQCASVRRHHRHRSPDTPTARASIYSSLRRTRAPRQHDVRHPLFCGSALKTAETTAGTIPSKRNEGMKEIFIGNTLRKPTARARIWRAPTTLRSGNSVLVQVAGNGVGGSCPPCAPAKAGHHVIWRRSWSAECDAVLLLDLQRLAGTHPDEVALQLSEDHSHVRHRLAHRIRVSTGRRSICCDFCGSSEPLGPSRTST